MLATLAGGVGAARFLAGLIRTVDPSDVVAIVNTADDDEFHGLHVSPDLDSVTYTLAGASNVAQGWGLEGETFATLDALDRYDVLPVFINCAADPRPSFRRARGFGAALGEFLAGQDMKVTVVGSGGLSHDPPTPRIDHSEPGKTQRLIDRVTPTQEELEARENRVIRAAKDLVVGKGPCLPPSEQWDRDFLKSFVGTKLEDFDAMTDAEIDRIAGFGAHEVRTWVAAGAAAQKMGNPSPELRYYHLVPEWITGMGIVVGQA